jgi:deoxyribose-phosphate aldolase
VNQQQVLELLRALGRELVPERPGCACHGVATPLCPGQPARHPGLAPPTTPADAHAVARLLDHTLLKPDATAEQVHRLCAEARTHGFVAVCVNPLWVATCARQLSASSTAVASVAGFPLGASLPVIKAAEASLAIGDGASEIDVVLNVGALKAGDHRAVEADVAEVAAACRAGGALLKVIIEAALLDDAEKVRACGIARLAGADFVKTSTGFGPGGATAEDVRLMRMAVGDGLGVKAAGGIRDWPTAKTMIAAGASRIGTSSGVSIVQQAG